MPDTPDTIEDVLRRHRAPDDPPLTVPRVSLTEAVATGGDPLQVLSYLHGIGLQVRTLEDLLKVNTDPDEDEVHAFPVTEGVAVMIASHDEWLLFTP